jgi:hypothetical protein
MLTGCSCFVEEPLGRDITREIIRQNGKLSREVREKREEVKTLEERIKRLEKRLHARGKDYSLALQIEKKLRKSNRIKSELADELTLCLAKRRR